MPVLVSTENGDITPGDLLTTSATPGYAMKATKAGQIIGQAMTPLTGIATGTVGAFIKTSYYNGTDALDLLSTENATSTVVVANDSTIGTKLLVHFIAKVEQLAVALNLSEIITDRLSAALEVITPKVLTGELATNKITSATGDNIKVTLNDGGTFTIASTATSSLEAITFDSLGNGSFIGAVTSQNITATNNIFAGGNLSVDQTLTVRGTFESEGNIFTSGLLRVGTSKNQIFVADSLNSKVSIGTTTANATLFVQGTSTRDVFTVAGVAGASLFSIVANGNVGVGTSSPLASFTVVGREGVNALSIASSTGQSFFTIGQNGFIGVGTSTALALLDVWGGLRVGTGTMPTLIVNTATNMIGIGNDGTQIDDEMLRVSGRIRATGFDIDSAADIAEKFEAVEALDAGTVIAFSTSTVTWNTNNSTTTEDSYEMSKVRKAHTGYEAVGVVSTNPGIVLGRNVPNGVPVAFSGRVPVKVTSENGEVKQGDYLTVSTIMPGYAMKLTGEGKSIGRALSDYVLGKDKVLMLVENTVQKLDLTGKNATTTGMLTTGNIDLNANGVAIINIKSLASANGTWSIDENGRIVAKQLCLEDLCIDKNTLTNLLNISGQTGAVLGTSTQSNQTNSTSTNPTTVNSTSTNPGPTSTSTDIAAPAVTLVGQSTVTIFQGDSFVDEGAVAIDDVDGDISSSIVVTSTVDIAVIGTYGVNYTSTDQAGNSTTIQRVVDILAKVEASPPPESTPPTEPPVTP